MNNLIKNKQDVLLGLAFLVFGLAMMVSIGNKWGLYTMIVFGLIAFLGGFMLVSTLVKKNSGSGMKAQISIYELLLMVVLVASVALITKLGFYATAFIAVLIISMLTSKEKLTVKSMLTTVTYSVVVCVATYFIFSVLLKMNVPTGILM